MHLFFVFFVEDIDIRKSKIHDLEKAKTERIAVLALTNQQLDQMNILCSFQFSVWVFVPWKAVRRSFVRSSVRQPVSQTLNSSSTEEGPFLLFIGTPWRQSYALCAKNYLLRWAVIGSRSRFQPFNHGVKCFMQGPRCTQLGSKVTLQQHTHWENLDLALTFF